MFSVTSLSSFPADNLGFLGPVPTGATGKPDGRSITFYPATVLQEGVTSGNERSAVAIIPESAESSER